MTVFDPKIEMLPAAQRAIWMDFAKLPDDFVLYGGTAIALYLGHRESVDFDFFSTAPLNKADLFRRFLWMPSAEVIQEGPDTLVVLASTPLGQVKISFFGGIGNGMIGPVSWTRDGIMPVASLGDLLAHKLKVILQRAHGKDYQDIAGLLKFGLNLSDGLSAAATIFGNKFPIGEALRALSFFEDIAERYRVTEDDKSRLLAAVAGVGTKLPSARLLHLSIRAWTYQDDGSGGKAI
jgi:hypothetical protein